jgi:hypothetical protein
MSADRKVNADKAVDLMRFYLGSVDFDTFRAQQKLYGKVMREVERLASKTGRSAAEVWSFVESTARTAGIVRPWRGKDT